MTSCSPPRKTLIAAAIVLTVFIFCLPVLAGQEVRVGKVVDGDSIVLEDGRRVRLLGINTPERGEPYFHKARRFVDERTRNRAIRLEFDQEEEDAHGRLLAYVHIGRSLLNEELVREGLAHVMLIGDNLKHDRRLLAAQGDARKKRKGLWSVWTRAKTLKITSLHPYSPSPPSAYARIVSLADRPLELAGHIMTNEAGDRFVFPRFTLAPGHSVIVSAEGGGSGTRQVFPWPGMKRFDRESDTAFLFDPAGNQIDQFHYSPKTAPRKRRKTP